MPIVGLKLIPGVDVEKTEALNQSGVSVSNLIRYESALIQKLGGWLRYYAFAFLNIIKDLHAWQDLSAIGYLSIGTATQLATLSNGALNDITPQTLVSDFAPNFTTAIGDFEVEVTDPNISNVTVLDSIFMETPVSVGGIILAGTLPITTITGVNSYKVTNPIAATAVETNAGAVPVFDTTAGTSSVTVTLADHALTAGVSRFTFPIATTGGGVTILGTYGIITVPTPDTFTISADVQASSTTTFSMNGGDAELLYYINLGPAAAGVGFGIGPFGAGGFGTGLVPAQQTGDPIVTTDWLTDNWGEDLIANPRGGGIYYWRPRSGFQNAALVYQAPPFNNGVFVAMPQQILVAWGSTTSVYGQTYGLGNSIDPMLVRWSDIQDFFLWSAASGNQAGSRRLSIGSAIKGAIQGPTQALIWTDIGLYAMQYVGYPLIWGFNLIGQGCGAVGAHSMGVLQQNVYWMSSQTFFVLGAGGVRELPCPVWDVIFQDLDTANIEKVRAAPNSAFGEFSWHYPSMSGGSGENDKYVMFHASESTAAGRPIWSYGDLMPRSAWIDQSVLGQPIGADASSRLIMQHETSYDADGQPLLASFETGWFAISEGWDQTFVDQFWPDFKFKFFDSSGSGASIQMLITTADYPTGTQTVSGPFTITEASTFIGTRCRGRLVKIAVSSSDVGTWWRTGNIRYRAAKAGRR